MHLRYLNTLITMLNGIESCLEVKTFFSSGIIVLTWNYLGIINRPVKFGLLVLVHDVIAEQKVD